MKGWKSQVKREAQYSLPVQLYPKQETASLPENAKYLCGMQNQGDPSGTPLVIMNSNFDTITL